MPLNLGPSQIGPTKKRKIPDGEPEAKEEKLSTDRPVNSTLTLPTHKDRQLPSTRHSSRPLDPVAPTKPKHVAITIEPESFEPAASFYPKVLNATMHPVVTQFMTMGPHRMATRYCHMNPQVNKEFLLKLLVSRPKIFHWGGADLFKVVNTEGHVSMLVIETNSCPSG
jgi:hypothetical protein